jgi:hypothetical protein
MDRVAGRYKNGHLKNARILLVMYGPAADVKEKSPVERFGSDAVMYPAS